MMLDLLLFIIVTPRGWRVAIELAIVSALVAYGIIRDASYLPLALAAWLRLNIEAAHLGSHWGDYIYKAHLRLIVKYKAKGTGAPNWLWRYWMFSGWVR